MNPIAHEENPPRGAFFIEQDGKRLAEMTYSRVNGALIIIDHTEVDPAMTGQGVGRKLLDYSLGLYAAPAYLDRAPKIADRNDLPAHRFVGYIEELLFTPELDYLPQVSPKVSAKFRSANLIAQLNATIAGFGIAVLPHFMATAHPEFQYRPETGEADRQTVDGGLRPGIDRYRASRSGR